MSFIIRTIIFLASTLGLAGNSLSLTYFLLHERKGLPNHLMIILNSVDFLIEGYGLVYSLTIIGNHSRSSNAGNPWDSSKTGIASNSSNTGKPSNSSKFSENCNSDNPISCANKVFLLFSVTSGYITLNLSVIRWMIVTFPFYTIRKKFFYLSLVIAAFTLSLISFMLDPSLVFVVIATIITLTVMTTVVTLYKLWQHAKEVSSVNHSQSEGAKTVVYIGITFILLNSPLLISFYIQAEGQVETLLVIMMINSTANPLVFIVRKKMLNQFVMRMLDRAKAKVPVVRNKVGLMAVKLDAVKETVTESTVVQSMLTEINDRKIVSSLLNIKKREKNISDDQINGIQETDENKMEDGTEKEKCISVEESEMENTYCFREH